MDEGGVRKSITEPGENKSAFWKLSCGAPVLAMTGEVMAMLWVMHGPQGLTGRCETNPER